MLNNKAQVKVDFLVGFFIFTVAVVYIASSAVQTFPAYVAQSIENNLRLEAWRSSNEFMRISEKNGVIDETALNTFSSCIHNSPDSSAAYAGVKNRLNVSGLSNIHLTFDTILFGITDTEITASERSGSVIFNGNAYDIRVRKTAVYFNQVSMDGGATWSDTAVDIVPSETYDISKIDYDGEFVILRNRTIDCGPNVPSLAPNAVVRRYSTYNGNVALAEITYW